jgi:hypothetical protein
MTDSKSGQPDPLGLMAAVDRDYEEIIGPVDIYAVGDGDRAPEPTPYVPRFTATLRLLDGGKLIVQDGPNRGDLMLTAIAATEGQAPVALTLTNEEVTRLRGSMAHGQSVGA